MATLKDTVRRVIAGYAGKGLNSISYLTQSDDGNVLTITDFAQMRGEHVMGVSVVVRIVAEQIIIERDQNDKLVRDALIQAGIAPEQIILAYAGAKAPSPI